MKKMWSRFIALILSLLIIFSISGCGTKAEGTPSDGSQAINEQTESMDKSSTKDETASKEDTADSKNEQNDSEKQSSDVTPSIGEKTPIDLSSIPAFSNKPYCEINGNVPQFTDSEITAESYEYYSDLDSLGRCGVTMACLGKDLMPTGERGQIGMVKPTGWHTVKYDCVDGKYLYNRSHLIGWQLSGENANTKNLITGTRYFNVTGMLPFENMVADYIKETNNHVMYRVTPIFDGSNLVANGVQMEAYSVEDNGDGISYNVFVYNNQPGVIIDYETGDSWLDGDSSKVEEQQTTASAPAVALAQNSETQNSSKSSYVLNTNTKKFHLPSCSSVDTIKPGNREDFNGTRDEVINMGYQPCGRCHP